MWENPSEQTTQLQPLYQTHVSDFRLQQMLMLHSATHEQGCESYVSVIYIDQQHKNSHLSFKEVASRVGEAQKYSNKKGKY